MKDIIERIDEAYGMTMNDDRSTVSINKADWEVVKTQAQKAEALEQRLAESRACREALGLDPDSEHVSPSELQEAIEAMDLAKRPDLRPGLEWAIARCKALQSQGFDRSRNDVLIKDFQNCINSLTKLPE